MNIILILYTVGLLGTSLRLLYDFIIEPIHISWKEVFLLLLTVVAWPVFVPLILYFSVKWRRELRRKVASL
jgi:hypothetical protein